MKKVVARGRQYYEDCQGNLILAQFVKESPVKFRSPSDVLPHLTEERTDSQENMVLFTLDGASHVIKKHRVTRGLVNQSQIHPREIFCHAIADKAVYIILAHNHPSGNTEPSESDLVATRRICEVGKTIGIPVIDHLIVSQLKHLSLREHSPSLFMG